MKVGRVYKIVHHQSDIVYVGSTFNELRYRFYDHQKKTRSTSICKYIQKYGKKNFKIMLIKEYQVCDRKHLNAWEQFWINKLICINRKGAIPLLNDKMVKIQEKLNREKNKDKTKKYQSQKVFCNICKCYMRRDSKDKHIKTKKHIKNLN